MKANQIDIVILSETWMKEEFKYDISGYSLIHTNRDDGFGGVALYICRHRTNLTYWTSLFGNISPPFLIAGDFNVHHTSFGSIHNNHDGIILSEAINSEGLCVLNDGSPTLLRRHDRNPSAVDLSICNPSVMLSAEWHVTDETLGSDHLGISIRIGVSEVNMNNSNIRNRHIWKIKEADWKKYEQVTDKLLSELIFDKDPSAMYGKFVQCINQAALLAIPMSRPYLGKKDRYLSTPWWDEECEKFNKKKLEAIRKYKRSPVLANYIEYKRILAKCRITFKQKKRDKWIEFCNSFTRSTSSKYIWDKVKALKNRVVHKNPFPIDESNKFLNNITPASATNEVIIPSVQEMDVLEGPFAMQELLLALKTNSNTLHRVRTIFIIQC
ncbi:uncharacterized protein LOC113390799 [Ctenocephalides felis]|uniref:uncharacterized protein LOC113390799 n=1 Tax=Ctenocephalides felis TaxID=7515 RepID=UPI000E6E2BCA|nr:uncharacterized protein LOC113390799 [Ctenocephalides felis]